MHIFSSTHAMRLLIVFPLLVVYCSAYEDLYILIDEISLYNCRGVRNEIKIEEEDVNIVNDKGNKVYYIHAPGNYSLHFKRIKVEKDFGFLAGEIGVTLQVPIIEGPAGIRFDLPYTMVPETGLLSQQCDEHSGIIERNGRQYCRYCDLCGVGERLESELNSGVHQFLPTMPGETQGGGQRCGAISAREYDFKRTISLPNRNTLEQLIRSKVQGVDDEVKKRLNKGRGRFQVFLNLISAEKPSISQKRWFDGSKECKCCETRSPSCGSLAYLYCNIEDCKSGWALQCLHNTARIAACYTVEFNYRMTTSYADVLQFLQLNGYPDQETISAIPQPVQIESAPPVLPQPVPAPAEPAPAESALPEEPMVPLAEQCVAAIEERKTHLRRYCTIFWNAKLCCLHCKGVC
ncbi:hypothetical protein Y032_0110g181 [Ancylostoma ceylanicum]|uniref:Uncharacterized protein n=2 Tax=Ancylostoma ceylanicum TaxID=53326 RepID=A0A016TEQ7_9BILA|nr:hypothetical protein Y032_0110g181 [Ancylostoma ceylanicum]